THLDGCLVRTGTGRSCVTGRGELVGEQAAYLLDDGVVVEAARRGDHELTRDVGVPILFEDPFPGQCLDRVGGAQDRPGQGGVTEEVFGEDVVDQVRGLVLVHGDLFEDHAAFGLHLPLIEGGVGDHVADDVDGQRQVPIEHLRVVAGVFLGGVGVVVGAHPVQFRGDLERGTGIRALEEQMFEEVRRTRVCGVLVPRTRRRRDPERDRATTRNGFGDHTQPTRQYGTSDRTGPGGGLQQSHRRVRLLLGGDGNGTHETLLRALRGGRTHRYGRPWSVPTVRCSRNGSCYGDDVGAELAPRRPCCRPCRRYRRPAHRW